MWKSLLLFSGTVVAALQQQNGQIFLFDTPETPEARAKLDKELERVFLQMEENYDNEMEHSFLQAFHSDMQTLTSSAQYSGFDNAPSCAGGSTGALAPATIRAYPGGTSSRSFGFDLSNMIVNLANGASGPANTQGGVSKVLAMQAISTAAMLIQGAVSDAVHLIPPMVSPPAWNNQPLPCMPMVTGHNCFGAVFHPITATDFVMADATDAALDGVIASFPQTYKDKVGSTSDSQYKACFSAFMSMKCGSLFPGCAAPQTGNDATARSAQRLPLCFTSCVATLVACPGFWLEDIQGECTDISVPPACTQAFFWRTDMAPPQYESSGFGAVDRGCPSNDWGVNAGAGAGAAGAGAGTGSVRLPSA